jgi:hypothetical protein
MRSGKSGDMVAVLQHLGKAPHATVQGSQAVQGIGIVFLQQPTGKLSRATAQGSPGSIISFQTSSWLVGQDSISC